MREVMVEPGYPLPQTLRGLSQDPWSRGPGVALTPWGNGSSNLG